MGFVLGFVYEGVEKTVPEFRLYHIKFLELFLQQGCLVCSKFKALSNDILLLSQQRSACSFDSTIPLEHVLAEGQQYFARGLFYEKPTAIGAD